MPEFSQQDRLAGYKHADGVTWFLFDADLFGVNELNVVSVTGAFRNWDTDMESPKWRLHPLQDSNGLWGVSVTNEGYHAIAPSTPFKFRINDGQWLDPPSNATNVKSGNLVFEPGVLLRRLHSEIESPKNIRIWISNLENPLQFDSNAIELTNATGDRIGIADVQSISSFEWTVVPITPIDIKRVFYASLPELGLQSLCRRDGWMRKLISKKELGANVADDSKSTLFRIFAPRAEKVRLYLYWNANDPTDQPAKTIEMQVDAEGVWEAIELGDLHGVYYDFTIHGPSDPGNYFFETHPQHISDPYARVSDDSFGKCRVWKKTTPASPMRSGRPKMEDVVAYEVHVQDFTDLLPVTDDLKGTMPAMFQHGLTNSKGAPIGFDHLINLGVNVVHLMPMQEFLHYPNDEWQDTFKDNEFAKSQNIDNENYQWGYRTTHAFAVESRYRKRGTEIGAQRDQFRDLVQAFHDQDIAVIIDLVPNHTGENMDGRHYLFNFNAIDLPYYYRTNERLEHIGPFGNEIKTEDRPMVQRWLVDQCNHFIDEFGIDGFRIDLAGQIDKQTLKLLRSNLGDDVIIYGEPWILPSDPDVAKNPDWSWYKSDAPITYFQDASRDAFRGPVTDPIDKQTSRGYAGGDASLREQIQLALSNGFEDEIDPNRGVNYLDIHDNWALADIFARNDWDGRKGVDEQPFKIAAGLLFTSLGPIVIHGGTEFMRSKGSAALEERTIRTASGNLVFHGKRDTYNCRNANQFVWENIGRDKSDAGTQCDYLGMTDWWKGMIAFRMSDAGSAFRIGTRPPPNYYRWFLPENRACIGYCVDQRVFVLINTSESECRFDNISLPPGNWQLIANIDHVDIENGVGDTNAQLVGVVNHSLMLPKTSLKIWVRK